MGTGASGNSLGGRRGRIRAKARHQEVRRMRVRRVELEGLEARTLLATIPAAAATAGPQNISSLFGNAGGLTTNESSPVVAVDPQNPQKLAAFWVDNDPALLGITNNDHRGGDRGGLQHQRRSESGIPCRGSRPMAWASPSPPRSSTRPRPTRRSPIKYATDPSVGFDASGNFYMLAAYHNATDVASSGSGALVLQKYNFTGNIPSQRSRSRATRRPNLQRRGRLRRSPPRTSSTRGTRPAGIP